MVSLIVIFAVVYVIVAIAHFIFYASERSDARGYYERESRKEYARKMFLAPIWPYLVYLKLKDAWIEADFNNKREDKGKVY